MAVPSTITDLSTTAASNSPSGSESIGTSLDDYLRAIQAIMKQGVSKGSDIASAGTITPPATSSYFVVTGTTGITAIGETYSWVGRTIVLKFSGALVLTHAAALLLPGEANITTIAGDVAEFVNESAGVWRCKYYTRVGVSAAPTHGQCLLSLSAGSLKLAPKNGNHLQVAGITCTVPDAGVTLAPPATSGTTYLIYAVATAGVITSLEASTTAHATSTTVGNKGVEIKSGDDTRTLVGIARTVSSAWVDTITQRFVRSYFNRQAQNVLNAFTATRSTTSGSFVEINAEIQNQFVCWEDDAIVSSIQGAANNNSASVYTLTSIGWDGVQDASTATSTASATGLYQSCSMSGYKTFSEGYHYATLMGAVVSGTGNWANGIAGIYTSLSTQIR